MVARCVCGCDDAAHTAEAILSQEGERQQKREPKELKLKRVPTSYSFACGGWLQFWMFGVARALQLYGLEDHAVVAGCSAGALTAAGLTLKGDFDEAVEFCKRELVPECRSSFRGLFNLTDYARRALIATANIHKWETLKKNLIVAVTKLPTFTGDLVDTFHSYEDLLDTLLASAAAFPMASCIYRRGAWCLDGGLSHFQPMIDQDTVTINPFYCAEADIKPSRYVPMWWALMPPKDTRSIDWLYDLGFCDGCKWIEENLIEYPAGCVCKPILTRRVSRDPHPFDVPKRWSMHRFLGYEIGCGKAFSKVLDMLLVFWLLVLWKPVCCLAIYAELALRAATHLVHCVLQESLIVVPTSFLLAMVLMPDAKMFLLLFSLCFFLKLCFIGPSTALQEFYTTFCCLTSVSLLLRSVPLLGTFCPLQAHDILMRKSFLYRMTMHII